MAKPKYIDLPISSLKPDPEGAGLLDAPQMQIYDRILMAAMKNQDSALAAAVRELSAVPVEERYISRIIAALGFAFGDFDSACVRLDLETLPDLEVERMAQLVEARTIQFCILSSTFFGEKKMQELITDAIEGAMAGKRPAAGRPLIDVSPN
jgi:hypothetical protein